MNCITELSFILQLIDRRLLVCDYLDVREDGLIERIIRQFMYSNSSQHRSDYFRSLFSSNFKEGSMHEISLEEVEYEKLSRLLANVHRKSVLPTDESVESFLKLAECF